MDTPRQKISIATRKYFPDIKESTLNSYTSAIKKLLEFIYDVLKVPPVDISDMTVLKNPEYIKAYVEQYEKDHGKPMPVSSLRNTYSILAKMFPEQTEYRAIFSQAMTDLSKIDPNVKTAREEENWIPFEEVKEVYEREYNKIRPLLKTKDALTPSQFYELSDFILLMITSGVFIPPRRSLDWTEMKIKNYTDKENYYLKGKFYFNQYKTADIYGQQVVPVPKEMDTILKTYIAKNPYEYLIVSNAGKKLVESGITPRLNRVFGGKNISTTMLRHIYLSHYHKDKDIAGMRETASNMGHSVSRQLDYVKI